LFFGALAGWHADISRTASSSHETTQSNFIFGGLLVGCRIDWFGALLFWLFCWLVTYASDGVYDLFDLGFGQSGKHLHKPNKTHQPINQSTNQPTTQPTSHSAQQSTYQSTNHISNRSIGERLQIKQPTNQPINQPTKQPANQSTNMHCCKHVNQPISLLSVPLKNKSNFETDTYF
jgi:hypothetical protein